MKKFLIAFFALIVIVIVFGCKKQTPTSTPASTPTVSINIADFESGAAVPAITCSGCSNSLYVFNNASGNFLVYGITASGGTPGLGNWYYSVTGTVPSDGSSEIGISIPVRTTASTGLNLTGATLIRLDYKYNCINGGTMDTHVFDDDDSIFKYDYNRSILNDNNWHTIDISVSGLTGTGSLATDLANTTRIEFAVGSIYVVPTINPNIEFSVDNIKIIK